MLQDGYIVEIPCIVKAKSSTDGKRLVSVEASSEAVDSEGDVILQKALLDSAKSFIATGHLDIDHLSELGDRLGIANPTSYIIGRPTAVEDLGGGRTGVTGEISRSVDGVHDPKKNKYDEFWDSLQSDPPVRWRASIYGYPIKGMTEDYRENTDNKSGAKRFLVKGIDWRSLAMTRNPINTDLKGYAQIVSAKAYCAVIKGMGAGSMAPYPSVDTAGTMNLPMNMDELVGQHHRHISKDCPHTGGLNSVAGFKAHFQNCCYAPHQIADLLSHALMYHVLLERKRA